MRLDALSFERGGQERYQPRGLGASFVFYRNTAVLLEPFIIPKQCFSAFIQNRAAATFAIITATGNRRFLSGQLYSMRI
jgi:hypothetical protein